MVDVRVGKHQRVDLPAPAQTAAVQFEGLFALALKKTAVEQDFFTVRLDQMLGTGHGSGGALKGNFHGCVPP